MSFISWAQDVGKALFGMSGQELEEQQMEMAREAYEQGLSAWEFAQELAPTQEEITPTYTSPLDIYEGLDPVAQQELENLTTTIRDDPTVRGTTQRRRLSPGRRDFYETGDDPPPPVRGRDPADPTAIPREEPRERDNAPVREAVPAGELTLGEVEDSIAELEVLLEGGELNEAQERAAQRYIDQLGEAQTELSSRQQELEEEIAQAERRGQEMRDRVTASEEDILEGVAGAYADEGSIEGQRFAQEAYRDIYEAGGLDDRTRAENEAMRQRSLADARAQRGAILQDYASRGLGGAGMEMSAQMQSGQSGANARYLASLNNLASGQQRAQDALGQSADISGQMREQSFDEESRRRGARDFWRGANQDFYQNLYSQDVQTRNRQQDANVQAPQQVFGNQATIAGGMSGAAANQGAAAQQQGMYYGRQAQQNAERAVGTAASAAEWIASWGDD